MTPAAVLLLLLAFVFTGLDAAWQAMDRVRLRHRADKGDRRAKAMMAWEAVRPQADLVLAWTSHSCAALSLILLLTAWPGRTGMLLVAAVFLPVYGLLVQVMARQIFRRLPFVVLSRFWWLVVLAGSLWSPLARPVARWVRRAGHDPLPRPSAPDELMAVAAQADALSPLEQSMLRSVLDFRGLDAGSLALPAESFACVAADRTLGDVLGDRAAADAKFTIVLGADGRPLGALSIADAALSGALSARAQSFARPLLLLSSDLPAWKVLAQLRRASTPVAEVRGVESGKFAGLVTEESVVARLLGPTV